MRSAWDVSTVNVVAAAGEEVRVAIRPVPSPNTCRLTFLRIDFASASVWRSSSLTNEPELSPVAVLMSWSVSSTAPSW
jgi:hypothetical protein